MICPVLNRNKLSCSCSSLVITGGEKLPISKIRLYTMAEARVGREINFDAQLEVLYRVITQTFDGLFQALNKRRHDLLSQLTAMKTVHDKNLELDEAIQQLRITKENAFATMTSNLLNLDLIKPFDAEMKAKEELKVFVGNLNLIEFRCCSERILKAIEETDLIELIPEYVGRENPILKSCSRGTENGMFQNPKGMAIDGKANEVYIADRSNHRIQVMSLNGEFLRSFTHNQLKSPHAICLSEKELFVTDRESYLLKFDKSEEFLKQTGSRGSTPGCFNIISGLCYEDGLVYVCDPSHQLIQIFDSNLNFAKLFAYGEISVPKDIKIYSNSIFILSQDPNEIYCYNKECQLQRTIQLTGQRQPMSGGMFFTLDSEGNFLISDQSNHETSEIRIFSPNGVLKHSLGRGHLRFLNGIALDNSDSIICVNYNKDGCFQRY